MREPEQVTRGEGPGASFCRFSSDDFRCDFSARQSEAGFELDVAALRVVWEPPASPFDQRSLSLTRDEFAKINRRYHEALEAAPQEAIGLEGAGESHTFSTLEELRDTVQEHLRRGFRAPDWLLPSLQEEIDSGRSLAPGQPGSQEGGKREKLPSSEGTGEEKH